MLHSPSFECRRRREERRSPLRYGRATAERTGAVQLQCACLSLVAGKSMGRGNVNCAAPLIVRH